jgi:hypothetical protein
VETVEAFIEEDTKEAREEDVDEEEEDDTMVVEEDHLPVLIITM